MPSLAARPAQFDRTTQHRRAMLAKINIARHELNMAEDDYRQILIDETGKASLKEMSEDQLEKVIARLKALGFQPIPKGTRRPARHPMAGKARALWISLHHLGVVRNASEKTLESFAKRQLKCERLEWAKQSDAFKLVEALKAMAERHGWPQTNEAGANLNPRELQHGLCEAILKRLKEADHVPVGWTLDEAAFRLFGIDTGNTESGYKAQDYQNLAQLLGRELATLSQLEHEA